MCKHAFLCIAEAPQTIPKTLENETIIQKQNKAIQISKSQEERST